jgi:multidrug efflux pump subunit AcrA (membrane-fusion protein)
MANKSYQLKVGVVSTIEELYVREGDTVKKGAKLAKIDSIIYRAPFQGTVTNLPYKIKENVFSNVPILTIVNLADRYLIISLEQQGALRVKQGQTVKMSFDTIREQNYDGVVQSVYSHEGNFLARIDLSNLPLRILPGMTADVAIAIETREHVILVPVAALERGGTVWRKRGRGIPSQVQIKTGIVDQAMAEVVSGDLSVGDRLLIRKNSAP